MRYSLAIALLVSPFFHDNSTQDSRAVARRTGTFQDARLKESSGVVASRAQPGRLWTINDSGNEPQLFLTDTTGAALATFHVRGAVNIDWEAMGMGRCGTADCLIIGDIGDNAERRLSVVLYRVPEPPVDQTGGFTSMVETLHVRYPDRPHDVEALYVEPDGSVVLITKGRRGGIVTFRVPGDAWATHRTVTAARADSLPIDASMARGRVVTDAAISSDGSLVAVRTYRSVYVYVRGVDGSLRPAADRPVCDITGLEPQGEGLDWWDSQSLVLTSERGLAGAGTITLLRCPAR